MRAFPTITALLLAASVQAASDSSSVLVESEAASFRLQLVASGLSVPWAMAFLPDGAAIISERAAGRLSRLEPDSGQVTPLSGGPEDVYVQDNAGMLDVILHPAYPDNGWIYYAYTAGSADLNTTVVERARLEGLNLVDRQRLFEARPWFHNSIVYGCRLAFARGYLFVTMGDRWDHRHLSQSPGSHIGKIMRLWDDGTVPEDNPYVDLPGAASEIWTMGNRNPQGLTVHPATGELWEHEHGPQGGDEINVIRGGRNYGWPVITYGKEYGGSTIGEGITEKEGLEPPVHYWVPSIAPSDMVFYTGEAMPAWRGNLFIGALAGAHLNRLVIDSGKVVHEERLLVEEGWRVRLVEQGSDGLLYIGTDAGKVFRLVPL